MLHGAMTKPVDITYVKKHYSCFEPMKDCLFKDYIIIGIEFKHFVYHFQTLKFFRGKNDVPFSGLHFFFHRKFPIQNYFFT